MGHHWHDKLENTKVAKACSGTICSGGMDKQKVRTLNELRIWLEKIIRTDVSFIKEDWDLFLGFSRAAAQMDLNKKISILAIKVEPVTIIDPTFWKWADQILDATLGTSPTRYVITRRSGTSQIDQSF